MKLWESSPAPPAEDSRSVGKVDRNEKLRWSSDQRLNLFPGDEIKLDTISDVKIRSEPTDQPKVTRNIKSAWVSTKGKAVPSLRLDDERLDEGHGSCINVIQNQDTWASKVELSGDLESVPHCVPSKKAPLFTLKRHPWSNNRKVIYECPCCPCVFTELDKLSKHLLPHRNGRNKCSNLYAQQTSLFRSRSTTEDTEGSKRFPCEVDFRDMLEHYIVIFKKSRIEGTLLKRLSANETMGYKSLMKPKQTQKTKRTFKCSHCTKVFSDKATCIKHLLYH